MNSNPKMSETALGIHFSATLYLICQLVYVTLKKIKKLNVLCCLE
jgi:hypothetical protein